MKAFIAASLLASASTVAAQYAIDPNSVSNSTRQYWCTQQQSECPLICLQTSANSAETLTNDCSWESLTYACVCSNGISPNVSEYSQTLPYFICQEWGNQCVSNCAGDSTCQSACQQDHPCGALNPTLQNTSTLTSTMMSTTTTANAGAQTTDSSGETIYSGYGGAAETGSSDNGESSGSGDQSGASRAFVRVWALSAGQTFGSLALVGAFIGGFAVLL